MAVTDQITIQNAHLNALERRGPPIGKMMKNPAVISSVVTAVMSVLAGGKVLFTDFDEETDSEDEIEEVEQVPVNDGQYYDRPGVQPLVPN